MPKRTAVSSSSDEPPPFVPLEETMMVDTKAEGTTNSFSSNNNTWNGRRTPRTMNWEAVDGRNARHSNSSNHSDGDSDDDDYDDDYDAAGGGISNSSSHSSSKGHHHPSSASKSKKNYRVSECHLGRGSVRFYWLHCCESTPPPNVVVFAMSQNRHEEIDHVAFDGDVRYDYLPIILRGTSR
mmetsp:Transcript_34341/g.82726  ORF Transcript_34341/g.82726 Transcript_34341/m.82726 type:complete len:182 (+) Transcript_34341:185-730(+)